MHMHADAHMDADTHASFRRQSLLDTNGKRNIQRYKNGPDLLVSSSSSGPKVGSASFVLTQAGGGRGGAGQDGDKPISEFPQGCITNGIERKKCSWEELLHVFSLKTEHLNANRKLQFQNKSSE